MIGKRGVAVAVLLGAMLGAAACGPKKSATMEPSVEQAMETPGPHSSESRVEQLGKAIDHFAAARKGLRGHADEQSRRDLAEALAKLADVLVVLEGPGPGGAFRQQMRIIERARTQLTSGSATAPEPTINAAVRAAQNALGGIQSEQFAEDEEVGKLLPAVRARVDEMDTVRGPLHGFVAAQALDEIGVVVQRMADVLEQRLTEERQPPATTTTTTTTAPATNPA